MTFLVLAVIVTLTAATTVWLARTRAVLEKDPDSTFWYTFAGLCVLAPAILIPALASNLVSLILLFLAGSSAVATHLFLRRRQAVSVAAADLATLQCALDAASGVHQSVLDSWACYLLDPEAAAHSPAMTNIQVPQTAALIRAMSSAERLKPQGALTPDGVASYQQAVASLVQALATAEGASAAHS